MTTSREFPDPVQPNPGRKPEPPSAATRALWLVADMILLALLLGGAIYWLVHR